MAGKGTRYKQQGFTTSKPLIPVNGIPMIIHAIDSYPKADKWVFVIRKEHLFETELISTIQSVTKNVEFIVDENPVGQLNSLLVAKPFFENETEIFVGACDLAIVTHNMTFDHDITALTFTQQECLTRNPYSWGWLQINPLKMSCKVPLSDNPYNDHALTGCFTFKDGKTLLKMAEQLMKDDIKVKGEFYVDSLITIAEKYNYTVNENLVNYYISWGTPEDYNRYNNNYKQWQQGFSVDPRLASYFKETL